VSIYNSLCQSTSASSFLIPIPLTGLPSLLPPPLPRLPTPLPHQRTRC
jgi:hypothetical protein